MALAACGSTAGSTSAKKPTIEPKVDGNLNWFSWADYVEPSIVSDFEKKYGVTVTISTFDSNDAMLEKLAAGLPYDLITDNSAYMIRSIAGGVVQPFDLRALSNYSQLVPYFRKPSYENSALNYSAPYSGGGTGIIWRTDKVSSMTQSWGDLWDHPEAKGHIFVLDYVEDTMGASLLRKGYNINSGVPGQVTSATDALLQLKPELGGVSSDTQTDVGNGNAWIHHSWVPDAIALMTRSKYADKLQFEFTPKEGIPFGMDLLSIGAKAKSPGTAMLFIDWMLSAEMWLGTLGTPVRRQARWRATRHSRKSSRTSRRSPTAWHMTRRYGASLPPGRGRRCGPSSGTASRHDNCSPRSRTAALDSAANPRRPRPAGALPRSPRHADRIFVRYDQHRRDSDARSHPGLTSTWCSSSLQPACVLRTLWSRAWRPPSAC